ncbi:MAG: glycosyltransferase family 39 protein [Acidobacteriota bacterium]
MKAAKSGAPAGNPPKVNSRSSISLRTWIGVGALLVAFAAMNILEMRQESCTSDEVAHLPAGYSYLLKHDFRMNPEHPPLLKVLGALPLLALRPTMNFNDPSWNAPREQYAFGYRFLYSNDADRLLFWGRMPIVLIAILLGFYVFRWAEQLYGSLCGLFALGLYAFCPNIIAHAHLVTTDLGVGAFLLIAFYYLWRHIEKREKRSLYWSAIAMGAALVSKFSAVMLFPMPFLLLWTLGRSSPAENRGYLASAIKTSKGVVTKQPRKVYQRPSRQESQLKAALRTALRLDRAKLIGMGIYAALAALVVQLSYVGSLDPTLFFKGLFVVNTNHNPNYAGYLHGHYQIGGWWYYFLVAVLVKATAPFVLLVIARLASFFGRFEQEWRSALFVLFPAILLFVMISALADPLGVRYVLPVFPFMMVFASGLLRLRRNQRLAACTLVILLGWHVTSSLLAYPNHIPYFNEIAGGTAHGTEWLDDSNVDWGQEMKILKGALDERGIKKMTLISFSPYDNPGYYGIHCDRAYEPPHVVSGYYVVSAHVYLRWRLLGFDWMRIADVVGDVGHSMFIFRTPRT